MSFIPRQTRIQELAGRAYERTRVESGSIAAAIAEIGLTFGENRRINDRKLAVENAMCAGANSVNTRDRFGNIALAWRPDVNMALQATSLALNETVRDRKRRDAAGFPLRHPDIENRLREARLFLRWFRRYGDRAMFPAIVESLTTAPWFAAEAAE